ARFQVRLEPLQLVCRPMVRAPPEQQPGVLREQSPRLAAHLRRRAALARCGVQRGQPGMGADPHSRGGDSGRSGSGPPDPGLAGGGRRPGSAPERRRLLPPAARGHASGRARPRDAGLPARLPPRTVRRRAGV
ncbi:MAG: hypothetical protein AVDCRST_MAG30-2849, partial [uncultured Solirubrobacteraceae bacterium]